jgi:surface protein
MEVLTNNNIKDAVNLWCDNKDNAIEIYGHISEWDVSRVTDMSNLFKRKINFNEDISRWDVSNVTDMDTMFRDASSFNQNINTKKITKDDGTTYIAWDTSNVTDMGGMFYNAYKFNQPITCWNVSNVTNMGGMFKRAYLFNQPLNNWDVSNVECMIGMFYNAVSFNKPINDWDISNVEYMSEMFYNATSFNDNEISLWIINDNCIIFQMFENSNIKRENIENKNYGKKIARYFNLPNPKTNDELEKIKIETIKKNIRILEENKNLPILCDDIENMIKDFLIRKKL